MPARRTASRIAIAPSSGAVSEDRPPRNLPIGVLVAATITGIRDLSDIPKNNHSDYGLTADSGRTADCGFFGPRLRPSASGHRRPVLRYQRPLLDFQFHSSDEFLDRHNLLLLPC